MQPNQIDQKFSQLSFHQIREFMTRIGYSGQVFDNLLKTHRRLFSPVPKGFILPEQVTKLLISNYLQFEGVQDGNVANLASMTVFEQLSRAKYPWYWLDKNLAHDLSQTNPPESIPKEINLPRLGLILVPKNIIETVTGTITFIAYCLFEPGKKIDFQFPVINKKFNLIDSRFTDTVPQAQYRLIWFGCEVDTYVYGGITGLVPEREELKLLQEDFEPWVDEETELSESNKILALLLNCLVYSNPLNTEIEGEVRARKGFGQNSPKKILSRPLWIGKGYTPVSGQSSGEKGTHASPVVHWRRGHWKRIAMGKGRKERKWSWIPPTMVNVGKIKSPLTLPVREGRGVTISIRGG